LNLDWIGFKKSKRLANVKKQDLTPASLEKFYSSVEELQNDLDQWLHRYNYERPHRGYRNMGRRPIETIEAGKVIKEQVTTKEAA